MLPNFGICCKELGRLKVRVFAHACAVSALFISTHFSRRLPVSLLEIGLALLLRASAGVQKVEFDNLQNGERHTRIIEDEQTNG